MQSTASKNDICCCCEISDPSAYWEALKNQFEDQTMVLRAKELELREKIAQVEGILAEQRSSDICCCSDNDVPKVFTNVRENPVRDVPIARSSEQKEVAPGFFQKVMENAKSILTMSCVSNCPALRSSSHLNETPTRENDSCKCSGTSSSSPNDPDSTAISSKNDTTTTSNYCLCVSHSVSKHDATTDSTSQEVPSSFSCSSKNTSSKTTDNTTTDTTNKTTIMTNTDELIQPGGTSEESGQCTGSCSYYPGTSQNSSSGNQFSRKKRVSCCVCTSSRLFQTTDTETTTSAECELCSRIEKAPCKQNLKDSAMEQTSKIPSVEIKSPAVTTDASSVLQVASAAPQITSAQPQVASVDPQAVKAATTTIETEQRSQANVSELPYTTQRNTASEDLTTSTTATRTIDTGQQRNSQMTSTQNIPCKDDTCAVMLSLPVSSTAQNTPIRIPKDLEQTRKTTCTVGTCPSIRRVPERDALKNADNQCTLVSSALTNIKSSYAETNVSKCCCCATKSKTEKLVDMVTDITTQEKDIKSHIDQLLQREKNYDNVFNDFQKMLNQPKCCCQAKSMNDIEKISQELKLENKQLKSELMEMKLELKHCLEKIEGPMQQKLETEKCKCIQLQQELNKASQNMLVNQDTYMREMNSLKLQLCVACSNMTELNCINKRLKDELASLDCVCSKLEEDLIKQKINEADTIRRLSKRATTEATTLGEGSQNTSEKNSQCMCSHCQKVRSDNFKCDSNLHVIARKLSKTLKDSAPCQECAKLPSELKGAAKCIRDLTDLVESRKADFSKMDGDKRDGYSQSLPETENEACQCIARRDMGAGETEKKVSVPDGPKLTEDKSKTQTLFPVQPTFAETGDSSQIVNIQSEPSAPLAIAEVAESRYYTPTASSTVEQKFLSPREPCPIHCDAKAPCYSSGLPCGDQTTTTDAQSTLTKLAAVKGLPCGSRDKEFPKAQSIKAAPAPDKIKIPPVESCPIECDENGPCYLQGRPCRIEDLMARSLPIDTPQTIKTVSIDQQDIPRAVLPESQTAEPVSTKAMSVVPSIVSDKLPPDTSCPLSTISCPETCVEGAPCTEVGYPCRKGDEMEAKVSKEGDAAAKKTFLSSDSANEAARYVAHYVVDKMPITESIHAKDSAEKPLTKIVLGDATIMEEPSPPHDETGSVDYVPEDSIKPSGSGYYTARHITEAILQNLPSGDAIDSAFEEISDISPMRSEQIVPRTILSPVYEESSLSEPVASAAEKPTIVSELPVDTEPRTEDAAPNIEQDEAIDVAQPADNVVISVSKPDVEPNLSTASAKASSLNQPVVENTPSSAKELISDDMKTTSAASAKSNKSGIAEASDISLEDRRAGMKISTAKTSTPSQPIVTNLPSTPIDEIKAVSSTVPVKASSGSQSVLAKAPSAGTDSKYSSPIAKDYLPGTPSKHDDSYDAPAAVAVEPRSLSAPFEESVKGYFPFNAETTAEVLLEPPPDLTLTTTITSSGNMAVITEGAAGVIETTLNYIPEEGVIEVTTVITEPAEEEPQTADVTSYSGVTSGNRPYDTSSNISAPQTTSKRQIPCPTEAIVENIQKDVIAVKVDSPTTSEGVTSFSAVPKDIPIGGLPSLSGGVPSYSATSTGDQQTSKLTSSQTNAKAPTEASSKDGVSAQADLPSSSGVTSFSTSPKDMTTEEVPSTSGAGGSSYSTGDQPTSKMTPSKTSAQHKFGRTTEATSKDGVSAQANLPSLTGYTETAGSTSKSVSLVTSRTSGVTPDVIAKSSEREIPPTESDSAARLFEKDIVPRSILTEAIISVGDKASGQGTAKNDKEMVSSHISTSEKSAGIEEKSDNITTTSKIAMEDRSAGLERSETSAMATGDETPSQIDRSEDPSTDQKTSEITREGIRAGLAAGTSSGVPIERPTDTTSGTTSVREYDQDAKLVSTLEDTCILESTSKTPSSKVVEDTDESKSQPTEDVSSKQWTDEKSSELATSTTAPELDEYQCAQQAEIRQKIDCACQSHPPSLEQSCQCCECKDVAVSTSRDSETITDHDVMNQDIPKFSVNQISSPNASEPATDTAEAYVSAPQELSKTSNGADAAEAGSSGAARTQGTTEDVSSIAESQKGRTVELQDGETSKQKTLAEGDAPYKNLDDSEFQSAHEILDNLVDQIDQPTQAQVVTSTRDQKSAGQIDKASKSSHLVASKPLLTSEAGQSVAGYTQDIGNKTVEEPKAAVGDETRKLKSAGSFRSASTAPSPLRSSRKKSDEVADKSQLALPQVTSAHTSKMSQVQDEDKDFRDKSQLAAPQVASAKTSKMPSAIGQTSTLINKQDLDIAISQAKGKMKSASMQSGGLEKDSHSEGRPSSSSETESELKKSSKKGQVKRTSEVPDSVSKLSEKTVPPYVATSTDGKKSRRKRSSKLISSKCDCPDVCQCVVCSPEVIKQRKESTGSEQPPSGKVDKICCCGPIQNQNMTQQQLMMQPMTQAQMIIPGTMQMPHIYMQATMGITAAGMPQISNQVNNNNTQGASTNTDQHHQGCRCQKCTNSYQSKPRTEAFLRSTNLESNMMCGRRRRISIDDIYIHPDAKKTSYNPRDNSTHPVDCECVDCICLPTVQELAQTQEIPIINDEKQVYQVHTMKCSCPVPKSKIPISTNPNTSPPRIRSSAVSPTQKPLNLTSRKSLCNCGDCECRICFGKTEPLPENQKKPEGVNKGCCCKDNCTCQPCPTETLKKQLEEQKTKKEANDQPAKQPDKPPTPPSDEHPEDCDCELCICPKSKSKMAASASKLSKQQSKISKQSSKMSKQPSKMSKQASMPSHPEDCDCVECVCPKSPTKMGKITESPLLAKPEDCDCTECSCPKRPVNATDAGKGDAPKPPSNVIIVACDCPDCQCDPCADPKKRKPGAAKITPKGTMLTPCDCVDCKCDPCADPNIKKGASSSAQPQQDHDGECSCEACTCHVTADTTKTPGPDDCQVECVCDEQIVKTTSSFDKDKHGDDCTCEICKCPSDTLPEPQKMEGCTCVKCDCPGGVTQISGVAQLQAVPPVLASSTTQPHAKGCTCEICKCPDGITQTPSLAAEVSAAAPPAHMQGCTCAICKCPGAVQTSEALVSTTEEKATHPPECICTECLCAVPEKHGAGCRCPECRCEVCPYKQDSGVHSMECKCGDCRCIECPKKDGQEGKPAASEAGTPAIAVTDKQWTPSPDGEIRHAVGCKCDDCQCKDCYFKMEKPKHPTTCTCVDCICIECPYKDSPSGDAKKPIEKSEQKDVKKAVTILPPPASLVNRSCHCIECCCDKCGDESKKGKKKDSGTVPASTVSTAVSATNCTCLSCLCIECESMKKPKGADYGEQQAAGAAGDKVGTAGTCQCGECKCVECKKMAKGPGQVQFAAGVVQGSPAPGVTQDSLNAGVVQGALTSGVAQESPASGLGQRSLTAPGDQPQARALQPSSAMDPPPFEPLKRKSCDCKTCTCIICREKAQAFAPVSPNTGDAPPFQIPRRLPCNCTICNCVTCNKEPPMFVPQDSFAKKSVPTISTNKSQAVPVRPSSAPAGGRSASPVHCACPTCTCVEQQQNIVDLTSKSTVPSLPQSHTMNCNCAKCTCANENIVAVANPTNKSSSVKMVDSKGIKHARSCTCEKCTCGPQLGQAQSASNKTSKAESSISKTKSSQYHTPNCTCDTCCCEPSSPTSDFAKMNSVKSKQSDVKSKPSSVKSKQSDIKSQPSKHPPQCTCCQCKECLDPPKSKQLIEVQSAKSKQAPELDVSQLDDMTLLKKIQSDRKENCECREQIKEIRRALNKIKCACNEAEMKAMQKQPLVKQASAFGQTMSGLKLALQNLQEKCKAKDKMIEAMTGELKTRTSSRTFDKVINTQNPDAPDYDKADDVKSLERSKHETVSTKVLYTVEEEKEVGMTDYDTRMNRAVETEKTRKHHKKRSSRTCKCGKTHKDKDISIDLSGFEIIDIRRITEDSIIVKWKPPQSKEVTGYDIFVNGVNKSKVMSGGRTSAMVHCLDLSATIQITIYAVTKCGRCEPPAIAIYEIKT